MIVFWEVFCIECEQPYYMEAKVPPNPDYKEIVEQFGTSSGRCPACSKEIELA